MRLRAPSALLVAVGFVSFGCAVGGDLTEETMLAAQQREQERAALTAQQPSTPGPNVTPSPSATISSTSETPEPSMPPEEEPEPDAPLQQPTVNQPSTPVPEPEASGGMGGESPRPVIVPPVTPTVGGAGGTGGVAPEPEPLAEPVPEPVAEPEPSPFPTFPSPEPEPAPEPSPSSTLPAPEPEVPEPEPSAVPDDCTPLARNMNSGAIGVEESCFTAEGPIAGWNASGLEGSTRTITVNGDVVQPGAALPDAESYIFVFSAGEPSWVSWNYW